MGKTDTSSRNATPATITSNDCEAQLQAVLGATAYGIVIINEKGVINTFNSVAEQIFGYLASEVIGQNVKVLMPEPYHSEHDGYLDSYMASGEARIIGIDREVVGRRSNGTTFPMGLVVSETVICDKRMFVGIVRNITEGKDIEQEIRDREARTRAIVETVVDGIITIDQKGIIETFNPAAEKIFGYPVSEVAGKNIKVLMPEPYHSEHDGYLDSYMTTGEAKVIGIGREVVGRRRDGTTFPMELAVNEMAVGGKRMFTGIVRDITERKDIEQQIKDREARTRAIVETVVDGIITINKNGLIETFNPAAEKIFGYQVSEVAGKNIKILMPEPYHSEHDGYLDSYMTTGEAKIIGTGREVVGRRRDGTTFPMELAVSEMAVGDKRMFTGIVRDITDRKQADKMKREFVSTVSHELRTPLTSIKGSLGLIRSGVTGKLPEEMTKMFDIAYNNSDRLVRLINDILDIEKIEAGKMDFQMVPMDLGKLLLGAIEANHAYGEEHEVCFVQTERLGDAMIYGDHDRLIQVLNNLLSNAAKFSPAGANVEVSLNAQDDSFRVAVTDYGVGIPDEFLSRVFSKFSQADSSDTRSKGGTGLGLSIAKAIVERHGGSLHFNTEVNKGTTFYFFLPQYHQQDMPSFVAEESTNRYRVLICEDEEDTATLLQKMLEKAGFTADIARTAKAAEEMLGQRNYDAMTLDLVLPDKNGILLFKALRKNPKYEDLPIVVVSAIAKEGQRELNGDAIDVVDWIEKPIDQDRLSRSLIKAVNSSSNGKPRILHIEDDQDILDVVQNVIGDLAEVETVKTLKESRSLLQKKSYDLVILDLILPDGEGEEVLSLLKGEHGKLTPVIVFSAKDISDQLPEIIQSALVKSCTTNELLLETIISTIKTGRRYKKT